MIKKTFYSLFGEIAAQHGWQISRFGDGWVTRFQKGRQHFLVHGHVYPLNSASSCITARDKAAASELMADAGVPCVPHRLILREDVAAQCYGLENTTIEQQLSKLIEQFGENVVLKPSVGFSGIGVEYVLGKTEALEVLSKVFPHQRDHALSPFVADAREIRVIVLDGEVLVMFEKRKGVDWRHNLAHGATAIALENASEIQAASLLARQALTVLGLRIASVDIFITSDGMQVIEVNSGVMLEKMADQLPDGKQVAKKIYEKIFFACIQDLPAD